MGWLREHCPRLADAHQGRLAEQIEDWRRRNELLNRRHRLERLVAHRELQQVRSFTTRDSQYIKRRTDKLRRAEKELAEVEALLKA